MHRGDERNVLRRVVGYLQETKEYLNLGRVEITLAPCKVCRYASFGKCFVIRVRAAPFCIAQEHRHVGVFKGPGAFSFRNRGVVIFVYYLCGVCGFQFHRFKLLYLRACGIAVLGKLAGDDVQLRCIEGLIARVRSAVEHGSAVIIQLRGTLSHDVLKHSVDEIYDRVAAPEVHVEIYDRRIRVGPGGVILIFLYEYSGLCEPELVYALLYVADHEHVVPAAYPVDQLLLDEVAVLILVHEDVVEPGAQFVSDMLILQYPQRKVIRVGEIHEPRAEFLL